MHVLVKEASNISSLDLFINSKQYYSLNLFAIFCATSTIAPGTCKKVVKVNLSLLVSQADLSQLSPASQSLAF